MLNKRSYYEPTFKQVTKTRYVQLVSELAQEIFVQHYTKLTPKVAAALADKYQSDILTDDEIHSGVINYFLIYLAPSRWAISRSTSAPRVPCA